MAFQKKASSSSEVVLGQSVAELKKVTVAIAGAVSQIDGLAEKAEGLQLEIASKEDRIKALDVEYVEIERQKKVDLEITLRASREAAAIKILEEQGKIAVFATDYDALKQKLEDMESDFDETVKKQVSAAVGAATGNFNNEKKILEAQYSAKEAGNLASIESLTRQVTSQAAEIERLYKAIESERQASIERAKAAQIGTMNVGSGYGK